MSRYRGSKGGGALFAALFMVAITVTVAVAVALGKALSALARWVATTLVDLASGDPQRVLRARARVATIVSAAIVLLGYATVIGHIERTTWHDAHAAWELLSVALLLVVGGLVAFVWRLATGFGANVKLRWPLVATLPGVLLAAGVLVFDVPTRDDVDAAVREGNLTEARIAADSLVALDDQSSEYATLRDTVHERIVYSNGDLVRSLEAYDGVWSDATIQTRTRDWLHRSCVSARITSLNSNDDRRLNALASAAHALPDEAEALRLRVRLVQVSRRPNAPDDCPANELQALRAVLPPEEIEPRAAVVAERVNATYQLQARAYPPGDPSEARALNSARAIAPCLVSLGHTPIDPTVAEIDDRLSELQAEQQRAAAEEAQNREREERSREREQRNREREQRNREREQRNRERESGSRADRESEGSRCGSRLQCCDGSCSPTCTVDRASYRGCCSHHGGICD